MALKAGNAQEAMKLYSEALEVGGLDDELASVLHSNVSAVHGRLGSWAAALAAAERCVALRPTWPKAHVRVGAASYGVSKFGESVAAYTEALRLAPGDQTVQAALKDAQKAKDQGGNDPALLEVKLMFETLDAQDWHLMNSAALSEMLAPHQPALEASELS